VRPFVRTRFGLLRASAAEILDKAERDREAQRAQANEEAMRRNAHAAGLKINEIIAMHKDGPAVIQRAIQKAIRRFPRAMLEQAYPCSACKTVRSDAYKVECEKQKIQPCFVAARFKGCAFFERAPTVA